MTVTTDPAGRPDVPTDPSTADPQADGETLSGAPRPASPPRPRTGLIIICGFLLVAEAVLGVRLVQARGENADARQQLDTQMAALDAGLTQLDDTRQRLAALQADTGDRQQEIDDTGQTAAVRQVEMTELVGQLGRIGTQVKDLQTVVTQNHSIDQTQVQDLLLLNNCLAGIKAADAAIAQGSTSDTISALKSVSDICEQTLQITTPGDTANFPFDFADPSVTYGNDGKYYAYSTNAATGNVQVISSSDLKKWEWVGGTLTTLPSWAQVGNTWAPSVLQRDNVFYMYYAAGLNGNGRHCISVAVSAKAAGPFIDNSTAPLMCDLGKGGVIDPAPFVASDGSTYLLWKSEGETLSNGSATLWARKLGADYKSFDGDPSAILGVDRAWEGRTVEAPSMTESDGKFILFYSGNRFDTADYAEGWAVCNAPIGPCTKPANNVLLSKHDAIAGPGGGEVFTAPGGQRFIAYHAWTDPYIGYLNKRQLHVDKLNIVGGAPQVTTVS